MASKHADDVRQIEITALSLRETFLYLDPDRGREKGRRIDQYYEGVDGLAFRLGSSVLMGIEDTEEGPTGMEERRKLFGENKFHSPPLATYLELFLATFEDPVLCILLGAVVIALIVGLIENQETGWIESVAIFIAVAVVSNVCAASDYNKQLQFEELNKRGSLQPVTVVRGGEVKQVDKAEMLVGDLIKLKTGDQVPADGVICPNTCDNVTVNEADLTGESVPVRKSEGGDIFMHADSFVVTGVCNVIVVAVGKDTLTGTIKEALMSKEDEETPLQEKLTVIADLIGYIGLGAAILTLLALVIRHSIVYEAWSWTILLEGFIVAVTIVVVAVPEGLPLAVTIALAYSMRAMYQENIFVKVLSACETMGCATCICSDKTGTLTTGEMRVAFAYIAGRVHGTEGEVCVPNVKGDLHQLLCHSIAINSDALIDTVQLTQEELDARAPGNTSLVKQTYVGSSTECALLGMANELEHENYYFAARAEMEEQRMKLRAWPFDSNTKRSSILIKRGVDKQVLYVKGAGESVLQLCTSFIDDKDQVIPLNEASRLEVQNFIDEKSAAGFRILCLAYKESVLDHSLVTDGEGSRGCVEYPMCGGSGREHIIPVLSSHEELTLLGAIAIQDPLRPEALSSVGLCKDAGVKVVMVTGDHVTTAKYIATQCGILNEDEQGKVMEASEFRQLYDRAFLAQFGTRLRRYAMRSVEETGELDELGQPIVKTTLKAFRTKEGPLLPWKQAIGPCCGKPPMFVQENSRDKADNFEDFPHGVVKKGVLNEWAFGVSNIYDPSDWPLPVQERVEALRQATLKICLESDPEKRNRMHDKLISYAEIMEAEFQAIPKAAEAVGKLGLLIIPPEDFLTHDSGHQDYALGDGGPLSQEKWNELDKLLFAYGKDGEPLRTGGLQVLARSLPDDKLKLVKRFMKLDEIVAVTGDGTNDAPALRISNVGMAMGSGTQVACDAADITILDDNFKSIVNAIKWGRNIFDNIRKFLQFQLTVNLTALILTFVMSCLVDGKEVSKELPLNAVQLLWVNLIMDSMGALALATEKPTDDLLYRPPHNKDRLISVSMIRMNICQAAFQLTFLFLFASDAQFVKDLQEGTNMMGENQCNPNPYMKGNVTVDEWTGRTCQMRQNTFVFNMFVFCQFWNEINCRKLKEINILSRFFDSLWFSGVLIFTFAVQVLMVEFVPSDFAGTNGLNLTQWGLCIGVGFLAIPVGFLSRLIPIKYLEDRFDQGADFGDDDDDEDSDEESELSEMREDLEEQVLVQDDLHAGATTLEMGGPQVDEDETSPSLGSVQSKNLKHSSDIASDVVIVNNGVAHRPALGIVKKPSALELD